MTSDLAALLGRVTTIGLDGDDTLWHSENLFDETQAKLRAILARHADETTIDARLLATETRNLELFGYGVKGFTLSMIETAIEVTDATVTAAEIQTLIDLGKAMLAHPVDLLDDVETIVPALAARYRLILVTKGDLFHQESKVARSGLVDHFERVEIIAEKDPDTYRQILHRAGVTPTDFLMIGNSVKSDVLPVLEIGGHAVHIPYDVTWDLEQAEPPRHTARGFWELNRLQELAEAALQDG